MTIEGRRFDRGKRRFHRLARRFCRCRFLAEAERQALEKHLADCPGCRHEDERYRITLLALQSVGDVPPPRHFFVYPQATEHNPWRVFRCLSAGWQTGAALAAALLVVFFLAAPAPTPKAAAQPAQAGKQEDLRKKPADAQEKVKQRQGDLKARRKKYQEYLEEIAAHLVEALANHGDSMTTLRPGEYLNLVLTGGETFGPDWYAPADGSAADAYRTIVISVQKSVVADYKAGRLTLETFKQKVLQYAM